MGVSGVICLPTPNDRLLAVEENGIVVVEVAVGEEGAMG